LLGGAVGVAVSSHWYLSAESTGTEFLRGFSFPAVAAKAGDAEWAIIEDRFYEPFPALGRSKGIARRIVARAIMPDADQQEFVAQFQLAAATALTSYGAIIKGQFDASQSSAHAGNGSPGRSLLDLPRRYYAIGDIHGVADVWCIAESGHVTVIISLMESL
jgi:hypothetical protein